MAAMTLAVGVAYREIYSWKTAILYGHFVCQGTPSFVALEKTGFFEESARAAYTSGKASSEFMLAMFDVVKIHTHQPATDNCFPSSTMLRNGGMTCPNMQASTYTGHASSEDSFLFITDKVAC